MTSISSTLAILALAAAPLPFVLAPVEGSPTAVWSPPWAGPDAALLAVAESGGSLLSVGLGGHLAVARFHDPAALGRLRFGVVAIRFGSPLCGQRPA